jgi:hypothetical protein
MERYGALWSQPVAVGRESDGLKNRGNTRNSGLGAVLNLTVAKQAESAGVQPRDRVTSVHTCQLKRRT